MRRADRLFQIIQILRRRKGRLTTARDLAEELEVSQRTVYRDMADLQAQRVPIEGEAGLGYMLRGGFELPPLMFTEDEIEALVMGVSVARSWGDEGLSRAAADVLNKVESVLPDRLRQLVLSQSIVAPTSASQIPVAIDLAKVRHAIRNKTKIRFDYRDEAGRASSRTIWPLTLAFFGPVWNVLGWCEMRDDFRAFRPDRMREVDFLDDAFSDQPGRRLVDYVARMEEEGYPMPDKDRKAAG